MHRAARTFRTVSARSILGVATFALLAACGRVSAIDSGLNNDLVLADQLQRHNAPALVAPQDSAPAAPPATSTPVREITRTRVVIRPVVRTLPEARPATPAVAATQPAPARAGTYDPGHTADGEVAGSERPASVERGTATDATYGQGTSGTDVASTPAPVPQRPQAQAARDGILGSVAGAIIGAAASHSVRGGLIGAVAGGALGAIYGRSVDRAYPGYPTYAGTRTSRGYRTYPSYGNVPYRTF